MACRLELIIGGSAPIELSMGDDMNTWQNPENIARSIISQTGVMNTVINKIKETKLGTRAIKMSDLSDGKLMGNKTLNGLLKGYPSLKRYSRIMNDLGISANNNDFNILLADAAFNINGNSMLGVTRMPADLGSEDPFLYIVRNNRYAVEDFLKYYIVSKMPLSKGDVKILNAIKDAVNENNEWDKELKTERDVITNFLVSFKFKKHIESLGIEGSSSFIPMLNNLVANLLGTNKVNYENESPELQLIGKFINNFSKKSTLIPKSVVLDALNEYSILKGTLGYANGEEEDIINFINELNLLSPEKTLEVESISKEYVNFKYNPNSKSAESLKTFGDYSEMFNKVGILVTPSLDGISEYDGFSTPDEYDSFVKDYKIGDKSIDYTNYFGYKVYRVNASNHPLNNKFIVTSEEVSKINPSTPIKFFNTLKDARKHLESKTKKNYISKLSLKVPMMGNDLVLKTTVKNNDDKYSIGSVFSSLDINLSPDIELTSDEFKLLNLNSLDKMMEAAKQMFEGYDLSSLTNLDKFESFIALQREYLNSGKSIQEALELVSKSSYIYYKVINLNVSQNKKNITYTLEKVNNASEVLSSNKSTGNDKLKHIKAVASIVSRLSKQEVKLMTSEEINQDFTLSTIKNLSKKSAFIFNGEIYINIDKAKASDVLHEYLHLFLGTMKSNPKSSGLYYNLLNNISSHKDYETLLSKFSNDSRAMTDKNEEIFVDLLSKHMTNNIDDWFTQNSKGEFEHSLKIAVQESINGISELIEDDNIFNTNLVDVFNSFSKLAFSSDSHNFLNRNDSAKNRETANRIKEGIKKGEIIEKCE